MELSVKQKKYILLLFQALLFWTYTALSSDFSIIRRNILDTKQDDFGNFAVFSPSGRYHVIFSHYNMHLFPDNINLKVTNYSIKSVDFDYTERYVILLTQDDNRSTYIKFYCIRTKQIIFQHLLPEADYIECDINKLLLRTHSNFDISYIVNHNQNSQIRPIIIEHNLNGYNNIFFSKEGRCCVLLSFNGNRDIVGKVYKLDDHNKKFEQIFAFAKDKIEFAGLVAKFSPDNSKLCVHDEESMLLVIDLNTKTMREITDNELCNRVSFSPDSQKMVYIKHITYGNNTSKNPCILDFSNNSIMDIPIDVNYVEDGDLTPKIRAVFHSRHNNILIINRCLDLLDDDDYNYQLISELIQLPSDTIKKNIAPLKYLAYFKIVKEFLATNSQRSYENFIIFCEQINLTENLENDIFRSLDDDTKIYINTLLVGRKD